MNKQSKTYYKIDFNKEIKFKKVTFAPQTALSSSRFIGGEESPDTTEKHSG